MTRLDETGVKAASEFWLEGRLVGRAYWNPDGTPCLAVGLRDGVPAGFQVEYHDNGTVYAEPFVKGLLHGQAKQFSPQGRLLLMSPFKRGTGIDYWCDDRGKLREEHPLLAGSPSGWERWWNDDQKSVHSETHWHEGQWHGPSRYWQGVKLARGNLKFFVHGQQVSKRVYIATSRGDSTLPEYRPEDDSPERPLPQRFIELRRLTRRRALRN
ncbi:toxin-antitoxin system YwqK family antitoxin [Pyxidicoccus caerfyrddinensis]|uniref:toxin-antitoxin system YwqK family antitoxin n=1 Tax=Pyxidicoccus caerfyrddinensis TaxID=2709663 RepID=UPI0013DC96E4|nr:hypothetical protein [Pyxidicoccus caerfyrddinensis]